MPTLEKPQTSTIARSHRLSVISQVGYRWRHISQAKKKKKKKRPEIRTRKFPNRSKIMYIKNNYNNKLHRQRQRRRRQRPTYLIGVATEDDARLQDGQEGLGVNRHLVQTGEPVRQVLLHGVQVLVICGERPQRLGLQDQQRPSSSSSGTFRLHGHSSPLFLSAMQKAA